MLGRRPHAPIILPLNSNVLPLAILYNLQLNYIDIANDFLIKEDTRRHWLALFGLNRDCRSCFQPMREMKPM